MRTFIFMAAIGIIVILVYALHINAILSCAIETTGTYIKGKEFQGRCLNKMSLPDIQKRFVVDQTYIIYVSNKNPGYFVISRKVPVGNMIGILTGIGIALLAVCLV